MKEVEYRVRPVTRYVVTRWNHTAYGNGSCSGGCEECGEFSSRSNAVRVMEALAMDEARREQVVPDRGDDVIGWKIDQPTPEMAKG